MMYTSQETKNITIYVKSRLAVFDGRFLRTHNIQRQVSPLLWIVDRAWCKKRTKACRDESGERLELFAYHCLFSQDIAGGVEGVYLK